MVATIFIFVDEGADVVLGGSGMDVVHAGVGDFSDVVLGDNGEVDFDTSTVPGTALVRRLRRRLPAWVVSTRSLLVMAKIS